MNRRVPDSWPMPFGKFEGTPIGDVPSWYLDRIRDLPGLKKSWPSVALYIEQNLHIIEDEIDGGHRGRIRENPGQKKLF